MNFLVDIQEFFFWFQCLKRLAICSYLAVSFIFFIPKLLSNLFIVLHFALLSTDIICRLQLAIVVEAKERQTSISKLRYAANSWLCLLFIDKIALVKFFFEWFNRRNIHNLLKRDDNRIWSLYFDCITRTDYVIEGEMIIIVSYKSHWIDSRWKGVCSYGIFVRITKFMALLMMVM